MIHEVKYAITGKTELPNQFSATLFLEMVYALFPSMVFLVSAALTCACVGYSEVFTSRLFSEVNNLKQAAVLLLYAAFRPFPVAAATAQYAFHPTGHVAVFLNLMCSRSRAAANIKTVAHLESQVWHFNLDSQFQTHPIGIPFEPPSFSIKFVPARELCLLIPLSQAVAIRG